MAISQTVPAAAKDERIEFKRLGFRLELTISGDGLICRATYTPSGNGAPMTATELQGFLTQARIKEGLVDPMLATLLDAAAQGRQISDGIIARGTAMIPGEDGTIQLTVTDALAAGHGPAAEAMSPEGRIDLRRVQSFLNVASGQNFGTMIPPGAGTAGITVRGQTIPAQPGTPLVLTLLKNVRFGDDGVSLFAESDGRLYWHGTELSVEEVYLIKGDVDFKVGNIVYNGYLDIKGDVLDGFTVQATKGIKIQGNIGVCEISSAGTISFCGMNGQGKGRISCGGQVIANFIHDAQVDAEGDVLVETEIRNSVIRTNGAIKINKGVLAGGEAIALAGIESQVIGTVTSQRTRLIAGVCHRDLQELNQLFNELKELVASFNAPERRMDAKEFGQIRADITARIQEVRMRTYPARNAKINVRKHLYEGVNITIGQISEDIREGRDGPTSIIENSLEGGFRYLGMTDLSVGADAIDESFRQQQLLLHKGAATA